MKNLIEKILGFLTLVGIGAALFFGSAVILLVFVGIAMLIGNLGLHAAFTWNNLMFWVVTPSLVVAVIGVAWSLREALND
jgi:hypothetical protein